LFKKLKALLIAGLALLLLVSTFNIQGEAATKYRKGYDAKKVGGKLVITSFSDATRLTPNTVSDSVSNRIIGFLFDGLVSTDLKNNIIPSVATKWTSSKDLKTWTFYMRKDVKWHDGKQMTADDVIFSFKMYQDKDSINPYKGDISMISSVTKKDNYTVIFHLNQPSPLFLYTVGQPIIPKHKFPNGVKDFNNGSFARNPVGSGPFKFKAWKTAQYITVVANKNYWDGRPYMNEITMKILPDSNVEVVNLMKNQVDFVESIAAKMVSQVTRVKTVSVKKYDQARYDYIGLNQDNPMFKDKRVRQALNYGLNRAAIIKSIQLGNATIGTGPFHPSEPNYNKSVKAYAYDVSKAKSLLDDAGWKMGSDGYRHKDGKTLAFEIAYNNGNKTREDIAKVAQSDFKKIGVKATPRSWDFSIELDKIDSGDIDCYIMAWTLGTNPDKYGLWSSDSIPSNNNQRVRNATIDKLMKQFRNEPNAAKRAAIYQQVHKILNQDADSLWLYYPKGFAGMDKDLGGVTFSLYSRFYNVIDWYWKTSAKRK
jgi:peptide/nickel transport system substrate-binding protein